MDFNQMIYALGWYAACLIVGFSSALIPIINIEAFILLLGYFVHDVRAPIFLLLLTLAHMLGKIVLYMMGRGSLKLKFFNLEQRVNRIKAKYKIVKNGSLWVILISALAGMPPFYVITIMAGTMKTKIWLFFSLGFLGRFIRFSLLLFLPNFLAGLFK